MYLSEETVKSIAGDIVIRLLEEGIEFLDVVEHPQMLEADSLERDNSAVYDAVNDILTNLKGHVFEY